MAKTIMDAIMGLRRSFQAVNAPVPSALIVDRETGIRLMCEVRETATITLGNSGERLERLIEHPDGSAWQEASVMGVAVRWPQRKWGV